MTGMEEVDRVLLSRAIETEVKALVRTNHSLLSIRDAVKTIARTCPKFTVWAPTHEDGMLVTRIWTWMPGSMKREDIVSVSTTASWRNVNQSDQ